MDWYELVPELSLLVPHCPEPTQVVELRRAARQFCQDTGIWSRPFDLYTVKGLDSYFVDPPEQASIVKIDWLSLDGQRLDGRNNAQEMDRHPEAENGPPKEYYWYPGGDLVVNPVPDKQHIISGAMSLQPLRTAETIPDWLGDQWGDGIISLAAARLASIPDKTWTDAGAAQSQMALYRREVSRAIKDKKGLNQPASRVVKYGGL